MIKTEEEILSIIKRYAFRGKIEEIDYIHHIITIKVSSRLAKTLLENHFKKYGRSDYHYKIGLLGWFECWFPNYQIRK